MLHVLKLGRSLLHHGVDVLCDVVEKPLAVVAATLGGRRSGKELPLEPEVRSQAAAAAPTPKKPVPVAPKPIPVEATPELSPKRAAAKAARAELQRTPEPAIVVTAPELVPIAPVAEADELVFSSVTPGSSRR